MEVSQTLGKIPHGGPTPNTVSSTDSRTPFDHPDHRDGWRSSLSSVPWVEAPAMDRFRCRRNKKMRKLATAMMILKSGFCGWKTVGEFNWRWTCCLLWLWWWWWCWCGVVMFFCVCLGLFVWLVGWLVDWLVVFRLTFFQEFDKNAMQQRAVTSAGISSVRILRSELGFA